MDPSNFECAICHSLLLDPVVLPCGHDYCAPCVQAWADARRPCTSACPLCREPMPAELGVCLRLRDTLEALFPQKLEERRRELQERKAAQAAAGAGVTHLLRPGAAGSTVLTPAGGFSLTGPAMGRGYSARVGVQRSVGVVGAHTYGALPTAASAATAPAASAAPASALPLISWTPPVALCFSIGWHNPADTRRRRSHGTRGRRRRVAAV